MTSKSMKKHLNGNQLKLIAIIAMTIDHLTWAFFPGFQQVWWVFALHIIGRLTAPIMWFFIAEGCFYTHDKRKYLTRLLVFAVISHFAYDFAFGIPFFDLSAGLLNRTSVMWSLFLAAVVIFSTHMEKISTVWKYVIIFGACILALPSEYSGQPSMRWSTSLRSTSCTRFCRCSPLSLSRFYSGTTANAAAGRE